MTRRASRTTSSADERLSLKAMLPAKTPFAVLIAPTRFEIRDRKPKSIRMRKALSAADDGAADHMNHPTPS